MTTTINNNESVFLLQGTGWNTEKYFCNLADLVNCAKQFEKNQPYKVYRYFNFKLQKLSVKSVIELLEANQLDTSFFKPVKMQIVSTHNGYNYFTGKDKKGVIYNIAPIGESAGGGYYDKAYILKVKQLPDLFN